MNRRESLKLAAAGLVAAVIGKLEPRPIHSAQGEQAGEGRVYQSISCTAESIEEVMVGLTAVVNGFEVVGPALIIRKWSAK